MEERNHMSNTRTNQNPFDAFVPSSSTASSSRLSALEGTNESDKQRDTGFGTEDKHFKRPSQAADAEIKLDEARENVGIPSQSGIVQFVGVRADDDDDRDRFSPPLNTQNTDYRGEEGRKTNAKKNNRYAVSDSARIASKEEKQRQNEEIAIMESSSISSETGSWESFLPQHSIDGGEPKEMCRSFLSNERNASSSPRITSPKLIKESTEEKSLESESDNGLGATGPLADDMPMPKPTPPIGACFIDASTLLDDAEIEFSNAYALSPAVQRRRQDSRGLNDSEEEKEEEEEDEPTTVDDKIVNMSDEQKLNSTKQRDIEYDIKDQYATDNPSKGDRANFPSLLNEPPILAPSHPTGVRPSHEQERKQGNFLFQNSIKQFSGHVMSPKMSYGDDNNSDFSLPSAYSGGSSDPYNDYASTFETSSHHSSNCGDRESELMQFSIGVNGKSDSMLIYPDTPHNSILHVNTHMLHRHSIAPSDSAIASLSSSESNGASASRTRLLDDRDVPIVSGGASIKDFTPKLDDNPRRAEESPIISLGEMHSLDLDMKRKPLARITDRHSSASGVKSWIVDMSDCNSRTKSKRRSSESSSTNTDYSERNSWADPSDIAGSHKGLGFYVALSDINPPQSADDKALSKSLNYHTVNAGNNRRKATGFFVDLSSDDASNASNTPATAESTSSKNSTASQNDNKKNMFSMFIDIGAAKKMTTTPNQIAPKRASIIPKEPTNSNDLNGAMVAEPIAQLRNRQSDKLIAQDMKRHSWNSSSPMTDGTVPVLREHKRAASTSSEKGIMSILDKIPLISKASSVSIDAPNSPLDDLTCSKSLSSYSNNSLTSLSVNSCSGRGEVDAANNNNNNNQEEVSNYRRRQRDAKIGETFDKSSQGSLTDGILSKNSSPTSTTDTDDVTYQNENEKVRSSGGMETIHETKEAAVILRRTQHTMETLQATIEKQKQLLNTVTEEPASVGSSSYVKLSDMDKPVPKFELHSDIRPRSVGSRIGKLFDSKIGCRNTWHHMSKSAGKLIST